MKIFKDWDNEVSSFVVFLGKEARDHRRRMIRLSNEFTQTGNVESLRKYATQSGCAMQSMSLYSIAKYHFGLDSFKRKHIKNDKNADIG